MEEDHEREIADQTKQQNASEKYLKELKKLIEEKSTIFTSAQDKFVNETIRVKEVTIKLEQANKRNKDLENLTEIQKAKLHEKEKARSDLESKLCRRINEVEELNYQVGKQAENRKLAEIKTDHLQDLLDEAKNSIEAENRFTGKIEDLKEAIEKEINTGINVETTIKKLLVFLENEIEVNKGKRKAIPLNTLLVLLLESLLRRKQSRRREGLKENAPARRKDLQKKRSEKEKVKLSAKKGKKSKELALYMEKLLRQQLEKLLVNLAVKRNELEKNFKKKKTQLRIFKTNFGSSSYRETIFGKKCFILKY